MLAISRKQHAVTNGNLFNPSKLSGLKLWLDADNLLNQFQDNSFSSAVTVAGDNVGGWKDRFGSNNSATQSNSSRKFILRRGDIYSATKYSLDATSSRVLELNPFFGSSCSALTMVFYVRAITPKKNGILWISDNGVLSASGKYIELYSNGTNGNWHIAIDNGSTYTAKDLNTGITVNSSPQLVVLRYDGTTIKLDVGSQSYSNSVAAGAIDLSVNSIIGNYKSAGNYDANYYFDGRYYSVVAYNRSITDQELTLLKNYYQAQFGGPYGTYFATVTPSIGTATKTFTPVMTRLSSGRLFVVYTVYDGLLEHSSSVIKTAYSDNDGATWSSQTTIIDGSGIYACNNGALLQQSNGNLILTYYREVAGTTNSTVYVRISTDNGATWGSEIIMGDLLGDGSYYVPYVSGVVLDDDTLLVCCYSHSNTNKIFIAKSVDGGNNWTYIPVATGGGTGFTPYNEWTIVKTYGSNIVGIIRNETDKHLYLTRSTDNGETWSTPQDSISSTTVGFPYLAYDSGLLLLYNRDQNPYIRYSWDNGNTWKLSNVRANPVQAGYNYAFCLVSNGRQYLLSENSGTLYFSLRATGAWV